MRREVLCRDCAHCVAWEERVAAYALGKERRELLSPDSVCLANYKIPVPIFGGSTPFERGCDRFESGSNLPRNRG